MNPGGYIFQRPFLRGLFFWGGGGGGGGGGGRGGLYSEGLIYEGTLRFKIDWASLIVGSKFTVFTLFYFVFEGNFPRASPRGLIFEGAI